MENFATTVLNFKTDPIATKKAIKALPSIGRIIYQNLIEFFKTEVYNNFCKI